MRKILLTVAATCAVLVLVPASALAHGHRGHHRHHARSHYHTFGSQSSPGTQSPSAGTVQSFTGGVLTIALTNGSTVSGQVTDATKLICQAADQSSQQSHDRNSGGDGSAGSGDDDQGQGDDNHSQGGENPGQGDDDQGQGDDDHGAQLCDTTNLTQGAVVQEAVLRVTGAGAVWDVVVLPAPPSSPAQPTSTPSSS